MPISPWRCKQTSDTSGTGTLTLNAAADGFRSFRDVFGTSAVPVPYIISGATYYEIGYGSFSGGSPGTLTRPIGAVVASSNGGTLVSLPVGTSDVFPFIMPEYRPPYVTSATITIDEADLGNIIVCTGSTARTINLPALSGVPDGAGIFVINRGTARWTIDPSGSETINSITSMLVPGNGWADVRKLNGAWEAATSDNGWRQIGGSIISGTPTEIIYALRSDGARFRLEWDALTPTADGKLALQYSTDGGSTYLSGASDYICTRVQGTAATASASTDTTTAILLTDTSDAAWQCFGHFEFCATGQKVGNGLSTWFDGTTSALKGASCFAWCSPNTTRATHVRLTWSTGTTFASGNVRLLHAPQAF